MSQSDWEKFIFIYNKVRQQFKMTILLICGHLMGRPLIQLFHFSNLLWMPNDHIMVDVEFFGSFLCSWKRTNFGDGSQLVIVNFQWPSTALFIFKAIFSFARLLEPPLHCTFISSSQGEWVAVVSCVYCFMTHLELRNITQICFLSNMISVSLQQT